MIRMVIFDMAGTTIDEDNVVYKCVLKALVHYRVPATLEKVLLYAAGKEKMSAIRDVYTEIVGQSPSPEMSAQIYETFQKLLSEAYENTNMKVFDGLKSTLFFLKKRSIKIVFNTGYNGDTARKILKKVDCVKGRDIDLLVTADMVTNARPAPDMIIFALEHFNINPKECIKIGDSIVDIQEGKNASVKFSIGITTGAQNRLQLMEAEPDFIIDNLKELIPIIENANNSL